VFSVRRDAAPVYVRVCVRVCVFVYVYARACGRAGVMCVLLYVCV